MAWDIIAVVLCVAVACWFMGRRLYRIVKNRGGCACDCERANKGGCDGSSCPGSKILNEIKPKK